MTDTSTNSILEAIERGANVFVSGVGGTGKSYTLKEIVRVCESKGRNIVLTSSTGVSAYNIGGCTLHSWAGVVISDKITNLRTFIETKVRKIQRNRPLKKKWTSTDTLCIDEISMIGATYFEVLDCIARMVRQKPELPFGGIQLVLSGDMLQLPPVRDKWIFTSQLWDMFGFEYYILEKCWRFDSMEWTQLLKRARTGELTDSDIETLQGRTNLEAPSGVIDLYPDNKSVKITNDTELSKNTSETRMFMSLDYMALKKSPSVPIQIFGESRRELLQKELDDLFPVEHVLMLKENCRVMLRVNLSTELGLVNGSCGIVTGFTVGTPSKPIVKFDNEIIRTIEAHEFIEEELDGEDILLKIRQQFPLVVAYSCSIHKSQGLTFDTMKADCGERIFTSGQAYVAMSRCKNITGLYLTSFSKYKVYPDKAALEFDRKMQRIGTRV